MPISGNSSNSGGGKKVYKALISQSGTDDPTVIVLENTIGDIVWTRSDAGLYNGVLLNFFTENKTFITWSTAGMLNLGDYFYAKWAGVDQINLLTATVDGVATDGLMSNNPISIEVYP